MAMSVEINVVERVYLPLGRSPEGEGWAIDDHMGTNTCYVRTRKAVPGEVILLPNRDWDGRLAVVLTEHGWIAAGIGLVGAVVGALVGYALASA